MKSCVSRVAAVFCMAVASSAIAAPITIDFETEDDFTTPLINGQVIDTEFGNLLTITAPPTMSHLGLAIFDSNILTSYDADLNTGTGNILILQDPDDPVISLTTNGAVFSTPNDAGTYEDGLPFSVFFNFLQPIKAISIDLIDIDSASLLVTLIDSKGFARAYNVPEDWTGDRSKNASVDGIKTLDLTAISAQAAEAGASGDPATVSTDAQFNDEDVRFLVVDYRGTGPSAGLDNLRFEVIPEPGTGILILAGATCFAARRRKSA